MLYCDTAMRSPSRTSPRVRPLCSIYRQTTDNTLRKLSGRCSLRFQHSTLASITSIKETMIMSCSNYNHIRSLHSSMLAFEVTKFHLNSMLIFEQANVLLLFITVELITTKEDSKNFFYTKFFFLNRCM